MNRRIAKNWPQRCPSGAALALLVGALGGCATVAEQQEGSPALWRVDHMGQTMWLFGTIHQLPPEQRRRPWILPGSRTSRINPRLRPSPWRTRAVMEALADADELVLEINESVSPARIPGIAEQLFSSSSGATVVDRLPPRKRRELEQAAAERGVDRDSVAAMDAAGIIFLLAMLPPRDGTPPASSVEFWLRLAARLHDIEITGLESSEIRIDSMRAAFAQVDTEEAIDAVIDWMQKSDTGSEEDNDDRALYQAWMRGDTAAFDALITDFARRHPSMYDAFMHQRIKTWMEPIGNMLTDANDEFIAVGMGHMVGPDGLIQRLRRRGYTVRRVH